MDNRYVSPDTWYDAKGKPFQPGVHYFVGGATKLYGAALYRLSQGGLRRAAAPRRHLAGLADLLRRAGAVLHARRAALPRARRARRGPDRAAGERAVPAPGRVARAADPAARRRPRGRRLPPVPRAVRDHARRVEPAVQDVHPLCDLRRLPVPRAREVGRRGARRSARARASERHAADEREGRQARDERRRARPSPRSSSIGTGRRSGSPATSSWSRAVRPTRPSCSCSRRTTSTRTASPTAPTRSAATTCSTTRRPSSRSRARRTRPRTRRRSGSTTSTSGRRLRVPARERPDGRQVDGADVPRRAAAGDEARARVDARADGASRDRLLALDRGPPAARQPGHRRRRRKPHAHLRGDEPRGQEAAVREGQVDARGARHEPRPPHPPLRVHEERHPDRRLRAPGGHVPVRDRPERRPCST